MSTFHIHDFLTSMSTFYIQIGKKELDLVYTTSYVRQILVGTVYYTARTFIGHDDCSSTQLWRSLWYILGGVTEIGWFASWATSICFFTIINQHHKLFLDQVLKVSSAAARFRATPPPHNQQLWLRTNPSSRKMVYIKTMNTNMWLCIFWGLG